MSKPLPDVLGPDLRLPSTSGLNANHQLAELGRLFAELRAYAA